eukprot:9841311-Alexandrium_andersonii.AAC.1
MPLHGRNRTTPAPYPYSGVHTVLHQQRTRTPPCCKAPAAAARPPWRHRGAGAARNTPRAAVPE